MKRESCIAYETSQHWVENVGDKGFIVWQIGLTHSTKVATIGYQGVKGLKRAKLEIQKREQS